jgi:hypothetical protein
MVETARKQGSFLLDTIFTSMLTCRLFEQEWFEIESGLGFVSGEEMESVGGGILGDTIGR